MNHDLSLLAGGLALACLATMPAPARADAVTDWNTIACDLLVQARMGTPPANRVMAIVQTAVHEAVALADRPSSTDLATAQAAAVAAANRVALSRLLPQQEAAIGTAYQAALAKLESGAAKSDGIAAGELAASRVLAWRAEDGAGAPDRNRPHAAPGSYVPTASVAVPQWGERSTWLLASPSQVRPGPPPSMASAQWARDFNEVKAVGSRASKTRTAEQTEIARFWDFSSPQVYHSVVRSVAATPGRTLAQNARFYAASSQAMDDALVAVMDAKYQYNLWRPVTAIRNGDRDDNPATELEVGWASLIDSPMHPEYPSAHSIIVGALVELLKAEVGTGRLPELSSSSPTAGGRTRRWTSLDAFAQEVSNSRVWGGIHYRFSIDTGLAMGRRLGALAVGRVATSPPAP